MPGATTYDFKNLIDENGFKSEDDNFYDNLRAFLDPNGFVSMENNDTKKKSLIRSTVAGMGLRQHVFLEDTSKVPQIDGSTGVLFKYILRPLILSLLYHDQNPQLIDIVCGFLNYHLVYHTKINAEEFLLDLKRFVRIIRLTPGTLGSQGYVRSFILGISSEKRGRDYSTKISSSAHSEADYREIAIARNVDAVSHHLTNNRFHSSSTTRDPSNLTLLFYSWFKQFEEKFLKARIRPEVAQFIKTKKKPLVLTEIDRLAEQIATTDALELKKYVPTLNRLKHEGKLSEAEHKKILEILGVPAPAQGGGAKKSKRKRRANSRRATSRRATSRRANKLTNKRKGRHNKKRTNKKN